MYRLISIHSALIMSALFLPLAALSAVPPRGPYDDSGSGVSGLRHEVKNHDTELRMLSARLSTQEELIDSLRDEIRKASKEASETAKGSSNNAQARLTDLEDKTSSLATEIAQLQKHSKAMADLLENYRDLLSKYQRKIDTLESSVDQQSKNSHHLEKSLGTLLDAVGEPSPSAASGPTDTYKVVSGDSLEKIARRHKTTIKALKELNGLDNDRIIIGQKIKVPPSAP